MSVLGKYRKEEEKEDDDDKPRAVVRETESVPKQSELLSSVPNKQDVSQEICRLRFRKC